jgi:hypothetical protein
MKKDILKMSKNELIKYEKIITLNDYSFDMIEYFTKILMNFMHEKNKNDGTFTKFFLLRLKDSENSPFAKDLVLEWAVL